MTATEVLVVCRHGATTAAGCLHHEKLISERLTRLYRPLLGERLSVVTRSVPAVTVALLHHPDDNPTPHPLPDLVVWGRPVGAAGPATDEELRAAAADDTRARTLLGRFVLVQLMTDHVLVRSGADLVHTLKHARGPMGETWATQGLAALVTAGCRPTVVSERVPEFVVHDFVFGDDELLANVRVLPEASVVHVANDRVEERCYWPVRERLLGGHTDPPGLRASIIDAAVRLTADGDAALALSAGRDSTLLASCLAEAGRSLPCFTIGGPDSADGAGAAAVAAHLGWPHTFVTARPDAGPSLDRLLTGTRWSEGMDTAWNFYPAPLDYDGVSATTHLVGLGGEMGRAFYWSRLGPTAPTASAADAFAAPVTGGVAVGPGVGALTARARAFAEQLRADGWAGTGVFDGAHARGRVRKWPARTPSPTGAALVTVYPSAPVARALLGLPVTDRSDARGFDAAAALGGDLYALAQRAVAALPVATPGWLARSAQRAQRRLRPGPGVTLARHCLHELGVHRPLVADLLGDDWWHRQLRAAPNGHTPWRHVWNAVAVEALVRVAADVAAEQATVY